MVQIEKSVWFVALVLGICSLCSCSLTGCEKSGAPDADQPVPANSVTFNKDIAPIIFDNCAVCHRPGELAPFPLLSYHDVKRRAAQIAAVTKSRYMPPWMPEPGYGDFVGQRGLRDEQIELIGQWVDDGAVEGDPADLPNEPVWSDGWQLGEPDQVVAMPRSYTLVAEGSDVFRNFVIPVDLPSAKYVRAVEFRPDNARVLHHAEFAIDRTGSSLQRDEQDPEPGFDGMDSGLEAQMPGGRLLGWTLGKTPFSESASMAWQLHPDTDFIFRFHMLPSGKPETIQSSLGLFFSESPPTQFPIVLRLGSRTIDIPAGKRDHVIQDAYTLPVDVKVISVYPHAHYLCKDMKGVATLPDGTKQWLIWIKNWDFNWQDQYRFVKPIPLPKGTTIAMHYTYDNSSENKRNPHAPPQRVRYGPQSSDEMGDLWVQLLPTGKKDQAVLQDGFSRKNFLSLVGKYEKSLEINPQDSLAHSDLGNMLVTMGRHAKAMGHFREALRIDPENWYAICNLASVAQAQGRLSEAVSHYRQALKLNPDYAKVHNDLGATLRSMGKVTEAIRCFRRALRLRPRDAKIHHNLALALKSQNKLQEATTHFRRALELSPDDVEVHTNLANTMVLQGDSAEAIGHYRRALQLNPLEAAAHSGLANALQVQGNVSEATDHYRRALQLDPGAAAHSGLASIMQVQGNLSEAIDHYRQAIELKPDEEELHYRLANALQSQGDLSAAIDHYRKALRLAPDDDRFHSDLASALDTRGITEEAIDHYLRALEINPASAKAHHNMGTALASHGQVGEAIYHFQQTLQIEPDHAEAHINLANAFLMQGEADPAIDHYRQGLAIRPDVAGAHYNMARALLLRQRYDEAIGHLRQAVRAEPALLAAHYELGNVLAKQGQYDQAVEHFRRVVNKAPDNDRAQFKLARALGLTGQPAAALKQYREALRLRNDWPEALNETAWILATHPDPQVSDADEAVQLAERAAELTNYQNAAILDTLAAAYAAAGQFDWAIETAEEALTLIPENAASQALREINERLKLYRQSKPYREKGH